jgi:two-component system OmpR family sensor kinase/two-component system sensor histidine kinase BaeS
MNSLAVKLMGAFAAVVLVGVAVVTIVANRTTTQEFQHFMFQGQMVAAQDVQATLADYYARNGSWAGVQQLLVNTGMGMGMMGDMDMMGMMGTNRLQVVDARTRQVVADTARTGIGRQVSQREWGAGLPIVVRGRTVGALLVQGMTMPIPQTSASQAEFLARVNRAVFLAALAAGAVALILGAVLVRQITAPLGELAQAAGRIAGGDLGTRVEIASSDELGRVGAAFNQMITSLSHQEQLRRNLMADIAHELRTPISVIQGQVEALQDGIFPLTSDSLEPIHNNARLLSRLVEDLRTLAQAEAGQLELDRQPVNLTEVVDDLFDGLRSQAEAKGVTLHADVPTNLPAVDADPQRLRQILLNLLSNALRHTPAGVVSVQCSVISHQSSVISHQLSVNSEQSDEELITDHCLLITVTDSGPGISPEDLPHIFDRFYRGDKSRSRQTGGMGLGLAIAKQLVELHGGRIWAESAGAGQGATFYVVLPLATSPTVGASQPANQPTSYPAGN